MTEIVRRINLLTALVLLLSGLLQPLAASQGVMCVRAHSPAQEAQQPATAEAGVSTSGSGDFHVATAPLQHDPVPQPGAAAPSVPCVTAIAPPEQRLPTPSVATRQIFHTGDLPLGNLFIQSLFRPPRLS